MNRFACLALAALIALSACGDGGAPVGDVGSVTVRVVADGEGISGVDVSLVGPTTASRETGGSGLALFPGVPFGAYAVTIGSVPPGFVCSGTSETTTVSAANPDPTVQFDCGVVRSASLAGRVTAGGGAPVEGAVVNIDGPAIDEDFTTGADGGYQVTGLTEGRYTITLQPAQLGGITCTEVSVDRTLEPGDSKVADFTCGGAPIQASVALERITYADGTPVDRSDVRGLIVVRVGIDENDQNVELLEVFLNGIEVCRQSFESGSAAVEGSGPLPRDEEFQVDCVINTAAVRDLTGQPPSQIEAEPGIPFSPIFLNGDVQIRALVTTATSQTQVATQEITLNNTDRLALVVESDNEEAALDGCADDDGDAHPEVVFDDEGLRWIAGDVCITAWPTVYGAPFDPADPFLQRLTLSFDIETTATSDVEVVTYALTDTEPGAEGQFFFQLDEGASVDGSQAVTGAEPVAAAGGLNTGPHGVQDFAAVSLTRTGQGGPTGFTVHFGGEPQSGTDAISEVLRIDNEGPDPGAFSLLPHDVVVQDVMPDADGDVWSDDLDLGPPTTSDFDVSDGDAPWYCVDGFPAGADGDGVALGEDWCDGDVPLRLGWVDDGYALTSGKRAEDDDPATTPVEFPFAGVGLPATGSVTYFVASRDAWEGFSGDAPGATPDPAELRAFVESGAATALPGDPTGADLLAELAGSATNDALIVIAEVTDRLANTGYVALRSPEADEDEGDHSIGHDATVPVIGVEARPSGAGETALPVAIGGRVNPAEADLFHVVLDDEDGGSGPAVTHFELHRATAAVPDAVVQPDHGCTQPHCYNGFDAITFSADAADVPELDGDGFHTFVRPLTVDENGDGAGTQLFDADPLQGYFWFRARGWVHAGYESATTADLDSDGVAADELWYLNDIQSPAVGVGLGPLVGALGPGDRATVDVAATDNVDLFRAFTGWFETISGADYTIVPMGGNRLISDWGLPITASYAEELEVPFYPAFETLAADASGFEGPSDTFYCPDQLHAGVVDHAYLWADAFEFVENETAGACEPGTTRRQFGPHGVSISDEGVTLLGQSGNFEPADIFERVCFYAEYDAGELTPASVPSGTPSGDFVLLEYACVDAGPGGPRRGGDGGSTLEGQAWFWAFPDLPGDLPDGATRRAIFFTPDDAVGLMTWVIEP